MTGPCFLGSPVPPVEPFGKPLLLPLQSSQNRLSLRTLQQTAAFRISGQEIGEKRRKASGSVRCYFRIRSSILGDSKEVVCEGLDRKTLKGWQCGLVGEVCLRSVSKYGANCSQLRLPSQRPGGEIGCGPPWQQRGEGGKALNRSSGKNSALCPSPLRASHVRGAARAPDNETF